MRESLYVPTHGFVAAKFGGDMNYDSELRQATRGALLQQYERGKVLFAEPEPHLRFSPVPLLCRSAESLWDAAMRGELPGEPARYHFTACTYAAVRGLDPPGPPGSLSRILPGVIDALNDWFDKYGVGVLEQTKHLGCVVGVMTQAGRLSQGFTGGGSSSGEINDAWINVLVRSVTAETLYIEHRAPEPLPRAHSRCSTGAQQGVGV